jgi:hypothetical protein
VSLILDALKKLERDKDTREPGVLVVGSVPWGTRTHHRRVLALALAGIGLAALVVFAVWLRDRPGGPVAAPSSSDSLPASAPRIAVPAAPLATTAPRPSAVAPPARRRPAVPPSAATPAPPPGSSPADREVLATPPVPPRAVAPAPDDLHLNAISQRDGRPVALINDRLVFEGDGFDGVKVLHIGEAEVEVEVGGKKRILRF